MITILKYDLFTKENFYKRACKLFTIIMLIFMFVCKRCVEASMQEIPPNYVDPDGI